MKDLESQLKALLEGTATAQALTSALQAQTQAVTDLLARLEQQDQKPDDVLAMLKEAMKGMASKPATVNVSPTPLQIAPQLVTPSGATWSIKATRTTSGFDMTVTKN
jgi:hypothetical protein